MRIAKQKEILSLFEQGYKEWPKGRTFEQYCVDNGKEDAYGTRYVLEVEGKMVCSLIVLDLESVIGKKTYGIGSVLTDKEEVNKGYATRLLKECIEKYYSEDRFLFLFSEIAPVFYERIGFRLLPISLQKSEEEKCMVLCSDKLWSELLQCDKGGLPEHF